MCQICWVVYVRKYDYLHLFRGIRNISMNNNLPLQTAGFYYMKTGRRLADGVLCIENVDYDYWESAICHGRLLKCVLRRLPDGRTHFGVIYSSSITRHWNRHIMSSIHVKKKINVWAYDVILCMCIQYLIITKLITYMIILFVYIFAWMNSINQSIDRSSN